MRDWSHRPANSLLAMLRPNRTVEDVVTNILVTGAAGMIGYHMIARLLLEGQNVRGCDSLTPYYDIRLKEARIASLKLLHGLDVDRIDLCNESKFRDYYREFRPEIVIHLAAQPGVRQGLNNPHQYVESNLVGFVRLLDVCREMPPSHLLYASSSSIYGANTILPWSEDQATEHPVSLYAATKKANEMIAHSYSHITGIPMTGLRFFTVYGEWGRPDMAPYKFTSAIRAGRPIIVYNHGESSRDFTYVGDTVEAVLKLSNVAPELDSEGRLGNSPVAPHRVVNIGSGRPVLIKDFIAAIEARVGRKANIEFQDAAPGDVADTFATTDRLFALTGYRPTTSLLNGLDKLCVWLEQYENHS
jgi:UDP-glucuronate 4-epimerase